VLTIFDLGPYERSEWYSSIYASYYKSFLPLLATRASRLITISEFSKQRIVDILKVPPEKITVTLLGVSDEFRPVATNIAREAAIKHHLDRPYILTVSAVSAHKNLKRLLSAWERVGSKDLLLAIVGQESLSFAGEGGEIGQPVSGVRYLGRVHDDDLPALYGGAIALAFPSLYEGFGLPVIEAMASGTPVLASNTAAIPEVLGEAGLMVDPYKVEDIAEGLRRIIQDTELRVRLRQKGLARAKQFNWNRTAELTWKALQDAQV
jgi:glycosyltransferase involved in cell wall biosynthesis